MRRGPGRGGHALRAGFDRLEGRALMATLPAGFVEAPVAWGLTAPTAMELAPNGRLYVAEQAGTMEVFEGGARLQADFFRDTPLTVNSAGERGLLGVALDPNFAANRFVYVYYTATTPSLHNRLSRFTADASGTLALSGSERVLLDLDPLSAATNHTGGAVHFGPDGKLYVASGDNADGANAQSLANLKGKILRLNADGSIPADNPFVASAMGANRAIWALGLRNPFTFAFQPGSGRMFLNDVGQVAFEEINEGSAGANYGWPATEGPTTDPRFVAPIYAYGRALGQAIAGGAFYNPATPRFPADYAGDYFFADFVAGTIRRIDPTSRAVADFASGAGLPVDLRVGDDGGLYYLSRGLGQVIRVDVGPNPRDKAPPVAGPFAARINFQPAAAPTLAGYQADSGAAFGARGGGLSFGWGAPNAAGFRRRRAPRSPDPRLDSFGRFGRGSRSRWEIAVPDGIYRVRVVAGDPRRSGLAARIRVEGRPAIQGRTTRASRWLDRAVTVTVSDGRLTLDGARGNVLNSVEIDRAGP